MNINKELSCVIIGEGNLALACAELLVARAYVIKAVISKDAQLKQWAARENIDYAASINNLIGLLGDQTFDYLFSIVNPQILPKEILTAPRKWAINYHDAPLPRYAGTHATSWALMGGERSHAVSWHLIVEQVDAGDILCQMPIDISPDETALTLNLKCAEAARLSFARMIDGFATGQVNPTPQDLAQRTFFAKTKRPPAACLLDWSADAATLSALSRALEFGTYQNPIGLPKIALGGDFYLVKGLDVLDVQSAEPGGTIISVDRDTLVVATATFNVRLYSICAVDGTSLSIPALLNKYNLRAGDTISGMAEDKLARLDTLYQRSAQHESFWLSQLRQLEPAQLPWRMNINQPGKKFATHSWKPPVDAMAVLQASGIKPADLLLTVFAIYLARLNGLSSFDLGYTDSKLSEEISELSGLFSPAVPLHFDLDMQKNFAENMRAVTEKLTRIRASGTFPKDLAVRYPQLSSILPCPIAVDIRLTSTDGHPAMSTRRELAFDKPDLTLQIEGDSVICHWIYNADLIDPSDIEQMAGHLEILLSSIAAHPTPPIHALPLLCEKEQHYLLHTLNDNQVDYPKDQCIHELFEAQVAKTPEHIAVVYENERLTYLELNLRANQLAHYLRAQGLEADSLVGLCVERGLDMIVSVLGILKAGGAYVPLDPAYPQNRLRYMVENSDLMLMLTQLGLQEKVQDMLEAASSMIIVSLDSKNVADTLSSYSSENPKRTAKQTSNNLAYVIYTSGSTGLPKGVMIEHRGAANLAQYQQAIFGVTEHSHVLCFASLSFDAATSEWLMALLKGASLHICTDQQKQDPAAIETYLLTHSITHATLPPALAIHLERDRDYALQSLILAGEACTQQLVQHWLKRYRVFNAYGPTETTVCASAIELRPDQPITIGRAMSNFQLYVLSPQLQLLPQGIVGELYIGGDGLARGYLKRQDLTAERFIPNPFSSRPNARLYKTGDLVRYLPDGNLEYIGRIDDQVKIRGFRIELGEIENQLSRHDAVGSAVVLAREDIPGEKRLVAYIKKRPSGRNEITSEQVLIAELKTHLRASLPEYMVPSLYVILDELPLTPNGKLDKKALHAPDASLQQTEYVAASSASEIKLLEIWAELLHLKKETISVTANFFSLGGHSLLGIQLKSKVSKIFGKEIKITDVFQYLSISTLAQKIDSLPLCVSNRISNIGQQKYYPVSFKQKTDWMSNQVSRAMNYGSFCCQISTLIKNIDLNVLRNTLKILIGRHEILRTEIHVINGQLRQTIIDDIVFDIDEVTDLSHLDNAEDELEKIRRSENQLFDFAKSPLFRVKVIRMREVDCFLFIIDHICGDQQFFDILFKEFSLIYEALKDHSLPALSPVELDYKSYANWEQDQLNGTQGKRHSDYWHTLLGTSDYPTFSRYFSDYNPPVIRSYRESIAQQIEQIEGNLDPLFYSEVVGTVVKVTHAPEATARYIFPIRSEIFEALQQIGVKTNSLLSSIIISSLHILLHKLTGREQVLMGILAEGRVKDELLGVGGCLINNIFSASQINAETSVVNLFAFIQKQMLASSEHKIYPFPRLLSEMDLSLEGLGLLELNYISRNNAEALPNFSARHENGGFGSMDINLSMMIFKNGIKVDCQYRSCLFKASTIETLMKYYEEILTAMCSTHDCKIIDLPDYKIATKSRHLIEMADAEVTLADY